MFRVLLSQLLAACWVAVFLFLGNLQAISQQANQAESHDSIELKKLAWQDKLKNHPFNNRPYKSKREWKKLPKKDRPDLAFEQNFLMTMDPALGDVPSERLSIAHNEASTLLLSKAPVAGVQWTERGPKNVAGRTRALMFDPNDATHKKVWAAGVGGGLWYTNDFTAAQPTWNRINDLWDNIAISTIAYNPGNTLEMYVGTGEGFGNGGAQRGEGIWKTTDGGITWNQLGSTDPGAYNSGSHFHYVIKLVVKSNGYVYAATRGAFTNTGGILRSTDGGATWTRVLTHYQSGVSRDHATDIEIAANGDLFASFGISSTGGLYKSSNADQGASGTWTNLSSNIGIGGAKRIELACAPSNASVIYAVAQGGSGDEDVEWFKKSTDGGVTWSNITIPLMVDGSGNHFTRSQAWYDLIMTVHPTNDQQIVVGGIDIHRSLDGGTTWTGLTHWYGGFGKPEVHADQHAMSYRPGFNNEMIFGNDGGVFYSTDAGNSSATPTFAHRNNGYNVTQFYACATKNEVNSNYFLAGAQDNGTQRFTQPQMNVTDEVTGGDGAFCHIDQLNPNIQITQYTNNNFYRSLDGGLTFPSIISEGTGRFINPSEYDSQNKVLYAASSADFLKRITNMDGAFNNSDLAVNIGGGQVSCLKKSPYNDVLFIGVDNGRIYKFTNASTATPTLTRIDNGSSPITNTGWASSIDIGSSDNQILVTYSSYGVISVWETANGGTTWLNKEGNLPDMPIRWAIYNPNNYNQVLAATEVGVWSTDNFQPGVVGAPIWGPSNAGLAHTRCDMLKYRPADNMVLVATHGRGLYTTDIFVNTTLADFTADPKFSCGGSLTTQFTDGSLKPNGTWSWDVNNDGVIDYTSQNPSHTYTNPGLYSVRLSIDNNASTTIKGNYIFVTNSAPTAVTSCSIVPNSNFGNNAGIGIYKVELEQIQKTTSNNDGYYNDYSCSDWAILKLNTTYTMGIKTGTLNPEGARVYIDWNNNGNLETSELMVTFPLNTAGYRTATFTTPSSGVTLNTPLRMRVVSRFSNLPANACNVGTYGQVEDYLVYVQPTPTATLALGNGNQTICAGQSTALKVTISGGIPPYTVKVNDGVNDQTISNYNSGTDIPVSPGSTTTYTISSITDALNNAITGNGSVVITVNSVTTNTTTQSACGSYTWSVNGTTYTQSGSYTYVNGCSTEILNLTINPVSSNTTNHTACDSYTWPVNGTTYTQSGTYTSVSGCVTSILNLTINNSTTGTTTATACDTYTWSGPLGNGNTYTSSTSVTNVTTNAAGCPHTETLNLTINNSTTGTTTATACDTYTWSGPLGNGNTYTSSTTATNVTTNAAGCLHTETLNLTINNSTTGTTTATACDTYTWSGPLGNGNTYTSSTTATNVTTNAAGCPHTETLNLTINNSTTGTTTATACDTYTWSGPLGNGNTYTSSTTATNVTTNAAGCPHTETLNLTINNSTSNTTTATACVTYTWSGPLGNGNTYTASTSVTNVTTNAAGCPHTETLNLTINNSTTGTTTAIACDTYTWSGPLGNGNTYTSSTSVTNVTTNAAGCPHTETLNLTINNSTSNTTTATACDSYLWSVNGNTYTQSGTYTTQSVNANGCTHTEILVLSISPAPVCQNGGVVNTLVCGCDCPPGFVGFFCETAVCSTTFGSSSVTACDSYTWHGVTYTSSANPTHIYVNAGGCDSIHTLNLTINYSTSNTTSATACDSYLWSVDGNTYTQSGTYTSSSTNANGCPHTETLVLTINNSTSNTSGVAACDSYTWSVDGNTYTQSGTYTSSSTNANGCPHTETLVLTINNSTSNTSGVAACDSYTWSVDGNTYTQSGTYTSSSTNANGCPHTETLVLTINNSTANTSGVAACDSYTWSVNGNTYTQSGTYTSSSTNANGCPHTETLVLTINNSTSNTSGVAACDSYLWSVDGNTYTQSGTYTSSSTNTNGCPHTETLVLTINNSTSNTSGVAACDSYLWSVDGNTYTQSGTYTSSSTNANGCPHTETLVLTINNTTSNASGVAACDSYLWSVDGNTYTQSGTYTSSSTNANGCPHTETLVLTINNSTSNTSGVAACDSYLWSVDGNTYTQSGTYTSSSTNANGCPHTETLVLAISNSTSNTSGVAACDSYLWSVDGNTYTQSGTYTSSSTNANGCPHTETLVLTINNSTSNTSGVAACDSYTWSVDGNTYTQSGTYTSSSTNANGCPHTETLVLTINNSTSNTSGVAACDSYLWSVDGNTYTQSGTYTSSSTNANGCPHTETLVLTINNSTSNTSGVAACDSYTWSVDGNTYTQSGTYTSSSTNANGCPHTETLVLTINNSTSNTSGVAACDSYTWSVDGNTYTQSGTYTSSSTNANGCPHTETLVLTINNSTSNTSGVAACDSYTWSVDGNTYTQSGTYTSSSTNANGCPHTETLVLTINNATSNTSGVAACDSYLWSVDGNTYTQSGTYTSSSTNTNGCPHTETLVLTINNSTSNTSGVAACDSYLWSVDGNTYTQSGTYTSSSTNTNGCPHTETLVLTINNSTANTSGVAACDSYLWSVDGNTYTQSGTYTSSSTNANGCTHTETLVLTINASTANTTTTSACGSFTWNANGMTYTQSGTYTASSVNTNGCAHTETLILTISNSTSATTTTSACTSYTWALDGNTYTQSGTYTSSSNAGNGCTHTEILILTINQNPIVTAPSISSCNTTVTLGGSPAGGIWNLPNPYSGNATSYTYYYTDANGCTGSATGSITTQNAIVSSVQASAITGLTALITWTPGAGIPWFEIRYKVIGAGSWNPTVTSSSTNKPLSGLTANTTYTVEVRGFCSTSNPGPWIGTTFTTNSSCGVPTGLSVTNITATTAKLNWTAVVGATFYTVRYRKVGTTTWTSGTSTSNTKSIAGLTANTNYEFQVSAHCGTAQTAFSASTNFNTLASKGAAITSIESQVNFKVYPNPTQSELNLDIIIQHDTDVEIQLMDMSGRVVKQHLANLFSGVNNITLDVQSLTNGVYTVKVLHDGELLHVNRITKN
ncbi:MAG: fibronectin type III domain-containing protein [Chitinophagaceae bacterium]|nr:fibronectin type III domain-containing protein [Chitinophagaceae bacterium]